MGFGREDYSLIHQWISYAYVDIEPAIGDPSSQLKVAKFLNEVLKTRVYIVNNRFTLADLALFCSIHSYVVLIDNYCSK